MTARGRGRGKPRDAEAAGRQAGAGPPRGPYAQMGGGAAAAPVPQQARAPATSAWGPSGGASARATHRPQAQPQLESQMQAMSLGAGRPVASEGPGRPAQTSGSGGNGKGGNGNGGGGPVGRGALRGRRQMETTVRVTKPAHISSKQGAIGKPIQLVANYFALKKHTNWVLRRYRVDISPDEDRTRERQNLLRVHRERLGGYLFDGTVLFTINSLTTPQNPTLTLTSQNREQTETYTLTVKEAGEVDYGDYAYVQVFNLLLRSCISALELSLVGRDYYDRRARIEVPRFRLELWPGYKTSIRQHEKEILMCVEITHKVMRMETALDILNDCYKRNRDDYRRDFVREVVGCIVLTKYNNKTYRVDDVAWDVHPRDNFLYRNEQVSFITYMQKKYDITIRDPAQPMLVSRAKARDIRAGMAEVIQLIPEVCYLTGLTDAMRNNFQLMRALAEYTKVAPDRRMDKLLEFNRRITTNEQAVAQMQRFQMKLEPDLVRIPGRTLPEENILLGAKNTVQAGGDVDWTKSLRNSPMLAPADLKNWVVLAPSKWRNDARAFVETLKRVSAGMQWRPREPELVDVENDNAAGYAQALTRVLDRGQPDLVLCAVPNNRGDRYSAIKKKCSVDRGVPSQVILCKNLNDPKKTMSIATKVAIQMNCKIGGAAWSVEIPLSGMMVVGFDVCHDTTDKSLSFGAMVASLDKQLTRYFSAVTPHRNGEELSNNLSINLVKALRKYSELNGSLPSRIIIYRDGVGEGQIPQVLDHELSSVLSRLTEVYGQPDAFKMTFIIVTKRINTRVFTDKRRNPPPGTVIDDVVTDPEKYDFFLVSQSVREGTVSPTSFNIIHDGVQLPPDRLQRLSYKLCHLYFNWSGTVRVPAPCQYAHKLAFLVGQALHREPSSQLEDLLHYL